MGLKWVRTPMKSIEVTAEKLGKAAEKLATSAGEIKSHGGEEGFFLWTPAQTKAIYAVLTLASHIAAETENIVTVLQMGHPLPHASTNAKSQKEMSRRKERESSSPTPTTRSDRSDDRRGRSD